VHRWVRSPETATASGASSAMHPFKESNCPATAGRPKCRSEVCKILTTKGEFTRMRAAEKPPTDDVNVARTFRLCRGSP
jgi:hypothetical protein